MLEIFNFIGGFSAVASLVRLYVLVAEADMVLARGRGQDVRHEGERRGE